MISRAQAGYVQTDHGRYFIEPVYQAEPEADGQHVHIAYKRDAPHEKNPMSKRHCGTSGQCLRLQTVFFLLVNNYYSQ